MSPLETLKRRTKKPPLLTAADQREMVDFLCKSLDDNIKTKISHLSMVEWAAKRRKLPPHLTPLPGPFDWSPTPYLVEIAECLSDSSPVQEVVFMKGARVGATVGVGENWVGYTIDESPSNMIFVGADKEAIESVFETRIDVLIELSNLTDKIFPPVQKKNGKATGDTKDRKDFAGGSLIGMGPNVGSKMRGFGAKKVIFDEVDAYKLDVGSAGGKTAQEGNALSLIKRRTDEYSDTRKLLYISTPLVKQTSLIEPLYLQGDQRKFNVPCKKCGEYQPIEWPGIKYEKDEKGRLIWESVHYQCQKCGEKWINADKDWFLPLGKWVPTAEAIRPNLRSYHLSSLYSPVGFRQWADICMEWIDINHDQGKLRTFMNTVLGETFEERGEAPRWERIALRREKSWYREHRMPQEDGTVQWVEAKFPKEALFLTIGADVQADRIECEVVAWSVGQESWSIGYHVLPGLTSDLGSEAWKAFGDVVKHTRELPMAMVLIDSHFNSPTVKTFVDSLEGNIYSCQGETRNTKLTAMRPEAGYQRPRVDLNVDHFKLLFYSLAEKGRESEEALAPQGYCHFPDDYTDEHFRGLFSEERLPETDRHGRTRYHFKKKHTRNEQLDCRVYNFGALFVFAIRSVGLKIDDSGDFKEGDQVDWVTFWEWAVDQKAQWDQVRAMQELDKSRVRS